MENGRVQGAEGSCRMGIVRARTLDRGVPRKIRLAGGIKGRNSKGTHFPGGDMRLVVGEHHLVVPFLLAAWICLLPGLPRESWAEGVLAVAKQVATTRFPDYHYGHDTDRGKVNCVQFLASVVEELVQRPLVQEERDAIYIRYVFPNLADAVREGNDRTRGVQRALCDVMRIGRVVNPEHVQSGDFIQYWIRRPGGSWRGHGGIVARVLAAGEADVRITLYGSHKSMNGIGEADYGGRGLQLLGQDRRVYIARFESEEQK